MFFKNSVFKRGINITVRRGTHWHNRKSSKFNILKSTVKRFRDIVDEDVKNEHDPSCRSKAGLLKEMKRVYPGFTANETVTLVEFKTK